MGQSWFTPYIRRLSLRVELIIRRLPFELVLINFRPGMMHTVGERPVRTNRQYPQHRGHAVRKKVVRIGYRREGADNKEHDALRPAEKAYVTFWNHAFCARACITHHHRSHQAGAGEKYIKR